MMNFMDNHPNIIHYGMRTPEWAPEDADTPETYAADMSGYMRAIVNPRTDGLGFCIETWDERVGITTFWTAVSREDAISFADAIVIPN